MTARTSSEATTDHLLSRRARDLPAAAPSDPRDSAKLISFFAGFPDPASLPADAVIEATTAVLRRDGEWALQYGNGRGYPGLADALLTKLARDQGINASRDHLLITAGASQAIALAMDALLDWGDTVVSEEPTWASAVRAFHNAGVNVATVPVDDDGTDVAALEARLLKLRRAGVTPKFIYVIPTFQNPRGSSTSEARRRRIVELAQEFGTMILEDDAYVDLRFAGERLPSLFSLDEAGTTLSVGTLSKTLGAGMRLGWVLGPPDLIGKMAALKLDGGTNIFASYVAAEWLPGHHTAHVAELRAIYHRRRDLMLTALARHMPEGACWTRPDGGFFIWVTLPAGVDTARMLAQAKERGVEYLPGRSCYFDGAGANKLRLSYSFASDDQIDDGIRIIAEIVRGELLELGA